MFLISEFTVFKTKLLNVTLDLENLEIMTCFLKFIPVVDKDFLAGCGESHSSVGAVGRSFLAGFKYLQYAHLKAVKLAVPYIPVPLQ